VFAAWPRAGKEDGILAALPLLSLLCAAHALRTLRRRAFRFRPLAPDRYRRRAMVCDVETAHLNQLPSQYWMRDQLSSRL